MEELELIIQKKKSNQSLTHDDASVLAGIIKRDGAKNQKLCEFLESLNISNFSHEEAFDLASAIADTGDKINISAKIGTCISKDSAGHVSDSVSLIVMSVLSSLGEKVVKMTTTRYGVFGNTISKLGMFDGFNASVGVERFTSIAEEIGCSILENKGEIASADIELGEIMDGFVVPSIPLLAVSLVAKKIALGASIVVYDVKSGEGGLVKTKDDAYKLGKYLVEVSKLAGLESACVVTSLSQPTAASIGAIAELKEVIRSLSSGSAYFNSDLMTVSKEIVEIALILSGRAKGRADASEMFDSAVLSGSALTKFREIVLAFGGSFDSITETHSVLSHVATSYVEAEADGYLADIDTPGLYSAYKILSGAENGKKPDKNAGIIMLKREGEKVQVGDRLARVLYSFGNDNYPLALGGIRDALCVKAQKPKREKLLVKVFV